MEGTQIPCTVTKCCRTECLKERWIQEAGSFRGSCWPHESSGPMSRSSGGNVESLACECSRINDYFAYSTQAYSSADHITRTQDYSLLRDSTDILAVEMAWQKLVKHYCAKALTYTDDILPALQGLVKMTSQSMGECLAGRWRNTLIKSLSWEQISDWEDPPKHQSGRLQRFSA